MNSKLAKRLRKEAKIITVGRELNQTKKVYKRLKQVSKDIKQGK